MATLAASAVTVNRSWYEGDRAGERARQQLCKDVTLELTGHGGTTNTITAAVLGLTAIYEAFPAVGSTELIYVAAPSYARTCLNLYDIETATDGDRADPIDVTDTVRLVVKGH
jgi:hypothetical protein